MFAVFFKKIKFKATSVNSKQEFLYLEFGAFWREVCGDSPIIDKWMYALKNLSRLEERPAALRERVFARLFEAAKIAVETVTKILNEHSAEFDRVVFNVFKDVDRELYEEELS